MDTPKTTCNKENGSFSDLWGRQCWVADSMLKIVQSRLEDVYEQGVIPEETYQALRRCIEELRVDNGLRPATVINWERKKAA